MTHNLLDRIREGVRNPAKTFDHIRRIGSHKSWQIWESIGFHLVPNHFYYPIPDTDDLLDKDPWGQEYPTDGIDLKESKQRRLIDQFDTYISEYQHNVTGAINRVDGALLYSMVREHNPERIIEVGSGKSTKIILQASDGNVRESDNATQVTSIEPYPSDELASLSSERENLNLIEKRAEDVPVNKYTELRAGDFLFIDSTHTLKIGGDVSHLYLKVLPQLPKGVFIHSHDIFYPNEYPKDWVLDKKRFWTEQYLLQSFLMFNDEFEVIWSGRHMYSKFDSELESRFPEADNGGGSFWIKRTH